MVCSRPLRRCCIWGGWLGVAAWGVVCAGAPQAQANWGVGTVVAPRGPDQAHRFAPQVAATTWGAVATWAGPGEVAAVPLGAAGAVREPVVLGATALPEQRHLSTDGHGAALASWIGDGAQSDRVAVAWLGQEGAMGPTRVISAADQRARGVRSAPRGPGRVSLVWHERPVDDARAAHRIRHALVGPDGVLGAVTTLSAVGDDAWAADIAAAPDGSAWVVWDSARVGRGLVRLDGAGATTDHSASLPAGAHPLAVATTTDGGAWLALRGATPSGYALMVSRIGADGSAGPAIDLGPLRLRTTDRLELAAGADGIAVAAWPQGTRDGGVRVAVARVGADGAADPLRVLSEAGDGADPRVAIDAGGTATVIWTEGSGDGHQLRALRIASTGGHGAAERLARVAAFPASAAVGATEGGGAVVVWVPEWSALRTAPADRHAHLLASLFHPAHPARAAPGAGLAGAAGPGSPPHFSPPDPAPGGGPVDDPRGGQSTNPAGSDGPRVVALALRPSRAVAGRSPHQTTTRLRVHVVLSQAARVRLQVHRRMAGRRMAGRCRPLGAVAQSRAAGRCVRMVGYAGLTRHLGAGSSTITIADLRVGGRRLAAGRYRVRVVVDNGVGGPSAARAVRLRVVDRP